MTNADLAAARARVEQRTRDLDDARTALAVVEHQTYADALQLIADEVGHSRQAATPDALRDVLSNIDVVLQDIGVKPTPQPQPTAVRR